MSKTDPSLLYLEPNSDAPFVVSKKPDFSDLPASDTLSRLRAFLPLMKEANEELAQRAKLDPKSVQIEIVDLHESEQAEGAEYATEDDMSVDEPEEPEKQVIQMDLLLVPDDSEEDGEEGLEPELDEDTTEDEELDAEGNPIPQILKDARAASKSKKALVEVLEPEVPSTDSSEE